MKLSQAWLLLVFVLAGALQAQVKLDMKDPLVPATIDLNKTYFIESVNSGLVLDVSGGSKDNMATVVQYTLHKGPNQQWKISSAGNGSYFITNVNSGKVLDIQGASMAAGGKLIQYANGGAANQKFRIGKVGNHYEIVAVHSGMALDVPGASKSAVQVQQYPRHKGANQQWKLVPYVAPAIDVNKSYRIVNASGGRALSTLHNSKDPNNKGNQEAIIQYDYYGDATQKWDFVSLGNDQYVIKNHSGGRALCTLHNSGDAKNKGNQEPIIQYDYYGDATQKWKIESVGNGWYAIKNVHGGRALCTLHNSRDPNNKGNQEPIIQYDYYGDATQHWKLEVVDGGGKPIAENRAPQPLPPPPSWLTNTRDLKVEFFNESGYVAKYFVTYKVDGVSKSWASGDVTLGFKKSVDIPARSTNVRVKGECNYLVTTNTIFDMGIELGGADYCIKTYGTAFSPQWNNNCNRFNPFADSKIHVANHTGENIYVAWSTEVKWSTTNIAAGVIPGLLIDNMHNMNANFYKYIALAAATDIKLPRSTYELFQKAALKVAPGNHGLVMEHSPLGTIKTAFDVKRGPLGYIAELTAETAKQSDEYKARNVQFNPILVTAGALGASTITVMVVNQSLTKFWIINSGIDDSWIVKNDKIVKATYGTINQEESGGKSAPQVKLPTSN